MNQLDSIMLASYHTAKKWGYFTLFLGILAIALPMVIGLAVSILCSFVLIFAGGVQLFAAWPGERQGLSIRFILALLTLVAGFITLMMPTLGLATLTLFIAGYFLFDGFANLMLARQLKPQHGWSYVGLGGLSSLILGLITLWQWPDSSEIVVGILIGIKLIILGTVLLTVGKSAKNIPPSQPTEKTINP